MKKILKGILILILAVGLSIGFGYSAVQVFQYFRESRERDQVTQNLIEQAVTSVEPERPTEPARPADEELPTQPEPDGAPIRVDFEALHRESEDIVAWLYSPNTPIDYPVAQSGDNEYYLRRLLDGTWNIGGTIFQDYRCPSDYSGWGTMIYGHHMQDGSMFGSLQRYKEQSYYEENPVLYLLTPEKDFEVQLFAGFTCAGDAVVYSIPQTREEKEDVLRFCRSRSDFESPVSVEAEDQILILSTCSYAYDNARYVVVGLLRELERPQGAG